MELLAIRLGAPLSTVSRSCWEQLKTPSLLVGVVPFQVIYINSMYRLIPKVGDKHFSFNRAYKWAKKGIIFVLGKSSYLDYKRNILGVRILFCKQYINLCPEKCQLCKLPICYQYEELQCFPVSFRTLYLESLFVSKHEVYKEW